MDMNSALKKIVKMFMGLALMITLSACQDTIPDRQTIVANKAVDPNSCTSSQVYNSKTKKCEAKVVVTRPDKAINFVDGYCGCNDGKAVTYGNCNSFCAGKGTGGADKLFATFSVGPEISLTAFKNVQGWCKTVITDTANAENPVCVLEAKDEDGEVKRLQAEIGGNSMQVNINDLAFDKTYVINLLEESSGSRSVPVQIFKPSVVTPIMTLGPLKLAPISQYTCIIREFSTVAQTNDVYYTNAYRMHFYFLPRLPPSAIPATVNNLFCHDIHLYGSTYDDPEKLYPRLETVPGVFSLWDSTDPRFSDNNGNSYFDVNDVIVQKTKNFGGSLPATSNFFAKFSWPGSPSISEEAGNTTSTAQPIGWYMAPWINQQTFKSYCLTQAEYNSENPVYMAMRDIIGVDTEGLYIGEKAAEAVTIGGVTKTGFKDYILIRESDLKSVWFYQNGGVLTAPTEDNVSNVAVYFYYPLNKANPFVKSATQRTYRVRGAKELSSVSSGSTSETGPTPVQPHDNKIGCVPKF